MLEKRVVLYCIAPGGLESFLSLLSSRFSLPSLSGASLPSSAVVVLREEESFNVAQSPWWVFNVQDIGYTNIGISLRHMCDHCHKSVRSGIVSTKNLFEMFSPFLAILTTEVI